MPTRKIDVTDHFERFIETGVTSGRYASASELIAEALRLLERREHEDEARIEWLRAAVKEGTDQIDRGDGIEFGSMDDLRSYIHEIGAEVSAEIAVARKRA